MTNLTIQQPADLTTAATDVFFQKGDHVRVTSLVDFIDGDNSHQWVGKIVDITEGPAHTYFQVESLPETFGNHTITEWVEGMRVETIEGPSA